MDDKAILSYMERNESEARKLLSTLSVIPAPSNKEEKRAEFLMDYLLDMGLSPIIDEALNVKVFIPGKDESEGVDVIMAHTDVVFPDTEALPYRESGDRLSAPGIGDDTANVVGMIFILRYLLEMKIIPSHPLLFVANSGEEGLGNLKGSRKIVEDYTIRSFTSFDGILSYVTAHAVGSERYRINVKTKGGHSFSCFGNPNAITQISRIIMKLDDITVPKEGMTTYNFGLIEGGTSVNTIAQDASLLYEYRSDNLAGLEYMKNEFERVQEWALQEGIQMDVECLGIRPCGKASKNPSLQKHLISLASISAGFYHRPMHLSSGSTDCNIPLSLGIPSVCFGLIDGAGAHTREEYILASSIVPGFAGGLRYVLSLIA